MTKQQYEQLKEYGLDFSHIKLNVKTYENICKAESFEFFVHKRKDITLSVMSFLHKLNISISKHPILCKFPDTKPVSLYFRKRKVSICVGEAR